jgi:F-type H+-transporting ATPase subunit delta
MSNAAIAERYARAIFELGDEAKQVAQLSEHIQRLADAYESSEDLSRILDNPVVDEAKRDAIIKDLGATMGVSQLALNAVRLLASRRRLALLPEVASEVRRLADEKGGVVRATVTSAQPLSESYCRQLVAELEKATNRKVLLEKKEDPSLLAGIVTRIGDHTIDGSLKGRLAALERQLIASA